MARVSDFFSKELKSEMFLTKNLNLKKKTFFFFFGGGGGGVQGSGG